ncbi:MAG: type II secretion system protein [bacterium]
MISHGIKMKKNSIQKNSGFTLIETIIYVAIFGMVIVGLAEFALSLNSYRMRTQVMLEVSDQGASLVRTITQSVRNGTAINSPVVGNSAGVLSIATASSSTNPTTFSASGEVLYMVEGTSSAVALTNNKVKVSNLVFSNTSRPATHGTVLVRFTLSNTASTTRAEEQYSVNFYGTATIR